MLIGVGEWQRVARLCVTLSYNRGEIKMSTQPTVKEVQKAIYVIRKFATLDDYTLCRGYLKKLVIEAANVAEIALIARDWIPVDEDSHPY